MSRITSTLAIAVLLCSTFFTIAAAAETASGLRPAADALILLSDNHPGSNLSAAGSQLNTAPVQGDASVYPGHVPAGYVRMPRPGSVSVTSINPQETLPYSSGISPNYAATYIGAAGVSSRTPSILASGVYARVGPQSIANLQSGEIMVLHQWGKVVNGFQPENDIVIGRNWTKAGYVDFTIYISAYGNPWVRTITCPASHTYSIYIKTVNPIGTRYSRLEFCVYDASALKSYVFQYALPASQTMDGADIALEKYYADNEPRPGTLLQWKSVSAFHVLDQNRRYVNLKQSGYVLEWLTSGVQTAYYHDYRGYSGVTNADGTFYLTRIGTGGSYPSHP